MKEFNDFLNEVKIETLIGGKVLKMAPVKGKDNTYFIGPDKKESGKVRIYEIGGQGPSVVDEIGPFNSVDAALEYLEDNKLI